MALMKASPPALADGDGRCLSSHTATLARPVPVPAQTRPLGLQCGVVSRHLTSGAAAK